MTDLRHPEFIAELESTSYPFSSTASLSNGSVSFLEGTFLDAHVYPLAGGSRLHISQVTITSSELRVYLGSVTTRQLAVGIVSLPITSGSIALYDFLGRPAGLLISEVSRLSLLAAWGIGDHVFEVGQTEFCISCQMPATGIGVSGFRLPDGSLLSGKVWLVGEGGVVVERVSATTAEGDVVPAVQISVVGDTLYLQRLCDPESLFVPVNPIRILRIVNDDYTYDCLPDEYGGFHVTVNNSLAPDAALRVHAGAGGIIFEVEGSLPIE